MILIQILFEMIFDFLRQNKESEKHRQGIKTKCKEPTTIFFIGTYHSTLEH